MGVAEAASEQTSKQTIAHGPQRGGRRRKRTPMLCACASMRRQGRGIAHHWAPHALKQGGMGGGGEG
jgi:hypothetical protein